MKHFNIAEFDCPCCGQNKMDEFFISVLDVARNISGVAYAINSGYRCKKHNGIVNGSPNSSHMLGLAADIRAYDNHTRYRVLKGLLAVGIVRIKIRPDFIHVDVDPDKAQEILWLT